LYFLPPPDSVLPGPVQRGFNDMLSNLSTIFSEDSRIVKKATHYPSIYTAKPACMHRLEMIPAGFYPPETILKSGLNNAAGLD